MKRKGRIRRSPRIPQFPQAPQVSQTPRVSRLAAILLAAAIGLALGFSAARSLHSPSHDQSAACGPSASHGPSPAHAGAGVLASVEGALRAEEALAEAPEATVLPDEMVYYNTGGLCYHAVKNCSGMKNAIQRPASVAIAAGKKYCPLCQPVSPVYGDWFRHVFGQELSGLYPGYRYRQTAQNEADFDVWRVSDGWREIPACVVERDRLYYRQAPATWEAGSVRLTLLIDEASDPEAFLQRAPEPIRTMAAADLAALSDETGYGLGAMLAGGSPAGRADAFQVVYDRSGRLTEFTMQLPGSQGTYRADWVLEEEQYRLYLSIETERYSMRTPEALAALDA